MQHCKPKVLRIDVVMMVSKIIPCYTCIFEKITCNFFCIQTILFKIMQYRKKVSKKYTSLMVVIHPSYINFIYLQAEEELLAI